MSKLFLRVSLGLRRGAMASESNDMEMNYREAATFLSNSERTWSGTFSSARVAERGLPLSATTAASTISGQWKGQVLVGGQNETCSGSSPSHDSRRRPLGGKGPTKPE